MPIVNMMKRASNYILGSEDFNDENGTTYEDNEVLFCKNNVCVHPPNIFGQDSEIIHHPGYLTVTTKTFTDQYNNAKRPTLSLAWIPNATLRKCPAAVEKNGTSLSGDRKKIIELQNFCSFKEELKQHRLYTQITDWTETNESKNQKRGTLLGSYTNPFLDPGLYESETGSMRKIVAENMVTVSVSSNSDRTSNSGSHSQYGVEFFDINNEENFGLSIELPRTTVTSIFDSDEGAQLKRELEPLIEHEDGDKSTIVITNANKSDVKSLLSTQQQNQPVLTSVNITIANPQIENQDLFPDESIEQNIQLLRKQSVKSVKGSTSESNLIFSDSTTSIPDLRKSAPKKCRRFAVDLSQMRSLRLFFSDESCTSGQLVIVSRESQFKILNFHHGGLDHLAQVLHQWHCVLHTIKLARATFNYDDHNVPYRQFMVCRPEIKKSELHPDEGSVNKITTDFFYGTLLNEKGQIEDDLLLKKCVFFGGLEKGLRKTVWPFLLHCYSFTSTFEDRALLMDIRGQEYNEITRRRLYSMSPEEQAHFWRNVQCIIEKDVVRTDRTNPYFAGDNNPNIESMKNILLNYAYYNSGILYTQGMSDLLAPVLCEIKDEAETFWCFVGLMQQAFFVCTPTDNDIDKNLAYLRELIRVMVPRFHAHLDKYSDSKELLFCHRWILLCFKREFTEGVAIRMWEACWSNYLTDYFHLFLCLAIIAVYSDDVVDQDLCSDEMLLHFSSSAMYMDGHLILRKARGLLYQFRQLQKIPCTLSNLCRRCGPGMWDSGHHPAIECIGHSDDDICILCDS